MTGLEDFARDPVLRDSDSMPFGRHARTPMQDVPAAYLLWLADEIQKDPTPKAAQRAVLRYVRANRNALEMDAANDAEDAFDSGEDDWRGPHDFPYQD